MGFSARKRLAAALATALAAAALVMLPAPSTMAAGEAAVSLGLPQQFYYEGDALDLRITVRNRGDEKIENPIKSKLFEGIYVRRDGQALERTGKTATEEPSRPEKLAPESFYGVVVNLVDLFPQLAERGTYEIYWAADSVVSEMVVATILPRFDPSKQYSATIETDRGPIVMDLFGQHSPIAVKAFVDLANAGLYDDSQISEIQADRYVVGGDPRFANRMLEPIEFPAERSALTLVAGTVVLRPVRATPPANGSTFMILLRPQATWTGQVTVLGQVVEGLDVVQRLSRLPSTMRDSQPNFKPLEDVKIKRVTIREKPAEATGS
jgi:cyclophilin family peptidyl-prolyl cis-trans isomerase